MSRVMARIFLLIFFCAFLGASCPKPKSAVKGESGPETAELFQQAEEAFAEGDYDSAFSLYQRVMEAEPDSELGTRSRFRAGQCLFKQGKSEEAREEFTAYLESRLGGSDDFLAHEYIVKILENDYRKQLAEKEERIRELERDNYRLGMLTRYLRKSVDSEEIYIEMDLDADRLFVKMGTQVLYEFPIVSGKGRRRLKTTGRIKDFSTPRGIRQVELIEKDPVWYRPDWVWLERGEEVPENLTMQDRAVPGVLGPYKISFGEGYYIHGTRRGTIRPGKYSHGCVRMNNKDLKQLVKMIEVGTMIYIY